MLKLTYTDNGFRLESLPEAIEKWVSARVLLALRSGTRLEVEPSTASFLLPADLPYLAELRDRIETEASPSVALSNCDAEAIEVILQGTWIASGEGADEGIFACNLSERVETFLYQVWRESEFGVYVTNE